MIDIQLKDTTADAAIAQIHTLLSDTLNKQVVFSNRIEGNRMIQSTYWAFHLVVYAFLIVIAGITILNIINSISMSVSARMKQYGILRAIGYLLVEYRSPHSGFARSADGRFLRCR